MSGNQSYLDRAAEALQRAFEATGLGEQGLLLDECLRLHRLALAEERVKLARLRRRHRQRLGAA